MRLPLRATSHWSGRGGVASHSGDLSSGTTLPREGGTCVRLPRRSVSLVLGAGARRQNSEDTNAHHSLDFLLGTRIEYEV